MTSQNLPIPQFFDRSKMSSIWKVPYEQRIQDALEWKKQYNITDAEQDSFKVRFVLIDCLNSFCVPTGELYVNGAVEDNIRLCKYIYENLTNINSFTLSLEGHSPFSIFFETFWVSENNTNPTPGTMISADDVRNGVWGVNKSLRNLFSFKDGDLQDYALDYVETLEKTGKYQLTIWPLHGLEGSIGNSVVSSVEETVLFHSTVRNSVPYYETKGSSQLTESYSMFGPEVTDVKNIDLIENILTSNDMVIFAGQAASHCVTSSIMSIWDTIKDSTPSLANNVFILKDCMSSVKIPGVIDFTEQTEKFFKEFESFGMNIITTETPIYKLV